MKVKCEIQCQWVNSFKPAWSWKMNDSIDRSVFEGVMKCKTVALMACNRKFGHIECVCAVVTENTI